jgi:UDP-glucose 4-epimerase
LNRDDGVRIRDKAKVSMQRILVTGAFGYLGLAVVAKLKGPHIVALGHAPRNEAARRVIPERVDVVHGDVLDAEAVIAERGPFDAVVHLAGGGGPAKLEADPSAGVRTNIRATTELLSAARKHDIRRLIYASTIAVYGTHREHGKPYDEADEPKPDDIYGVIKESAEHAWIALGGGTALRIANIYGAGAGIDMGIMGAVERFARAAASGGELSVFGEGSQRIDYVHVNDVVRAIDLSLSASDLPAAINVGGGAPIAISELAEQAVTGGKLIGKRPVIVRKPAPPGKSWPDRSLAIGLAKRALGWEPRVSYEEGMNELVRMMAS